MVLEFKPQGIYCPSGDFFIDPWRPVERALITHGHADHARPGHANYLATNAAAPVIKHRLGQITLETIEFGETRQIGSAKVSFHPAGHVPGSAQIRVEHAGEIWVVSGDYKTAPDRLSEPFEPVPCHSFVTECTFGLPVFNWITEETAAKQINEWWAANASAGKFSLLGAYSLGKAQRVLSLLKPDIAPILTHGAVENTNRVLRGQGIALPDTIRVTPNLASKDHPGALVLAPPSAIGSGWSRRFRPASTGFASGWMQLRGVRRRRAVDRGFVISDHADWTGLNSAIAETGAENIYATHGYTDVFARWLTEQGYNAQIVPTEFTGESLDQTSGDDDSESDREDGVESDRESNGQEGAA
ncbi:MAG: ligase-associated DNA damage response exonuclease [Pseudomonadota bacterium]